jgi:signal peptidase II
MANLNFPRLLAMFAVTLVMFGLDQGLKNWVATNMTLHYPSIPLIPGYFALTYTQNFGAAWSILWGQKMLLSLIASSVSIGLVIYAVRLKQKPWLQMIGLGFILAAALGNLVDRLRLGYVVDMFDIQNHSQNIFPIFNIADMSLDIGVGVLLLWSYLDSKEAKKQENQTQETNASLKDKNAV